MHGITRNSRVLCPSGCGVKEVSAINDSTIQLECGHERGQLLPSVPGSISLEHLTTRLGHKLFPGKSKREGI